MSGQAYLLLLIVLSVFGAAFQTQTAWLYLFGACGLALVLASWFSAKANMLGLRLRALPIAPTTQGLAAAVTLQLERRWKGASYYMQAFLAPRPLPWWFSLWRPRLVPEHCGTAVAQKVTREEPVTLRFNLPTERRGEFKLPEVTLQSAFPLGLIAMIWRYELEASYLVYPAGPRLNGLPWLESGALGHVPSRAVSTGHGLLMRSVREYRPGDALRQIHWPSTARTGRLHAKESEREVGSELVIFLDLRQACHSVASLEHLITIAASLVAYARERGRPVRLVTQPEAMPQAAGALEDAELAWLARARAIAEAPPTGPAGCVLLSSVPIPGWREWAASFIFAPENSLPADASVVCPLGADIAERLERGTP